MRSLISVLAAVMLITLPIPTLALPEEDGTFVYTGHLRVDADQEHTINLSDMAPANWNKQADITLRPDFLEPRTDIPGGDEPFALSQFDMDGDGDPDIVACNYVSSDVTVFENDDGNLRPIRNISVGKGPFSLDTGHINGNGILDIAVVNKLDDTVSIIMDLEQRKDLKVGRGGVNENAFPKAVRIEDINGDGRPEIITANELDDSISILHLDLEGAKLLKEKTDITLPGHVLGLTIIGDEIITGVRTDTGGALYRIKGDKSGKPEMMAALGEEYVVDITSGDVDGDGQEDIIGITRAGNLITHTSAGITKYPIGGMPRALCMGDIDLDGDTDALVVREQAFSADVYLNDGGEFGYSTTVSTGSYPRDVILEDVDGDGDLDIITANENDDSISVVDNTFCGTYTLYPQYEVGKFPRGVAAGDLDGDGTTEIVTGDAATGKVSVFSWNGTLVKTVDIETGGYPREIIPFSCTAASGFAVALESAKTVALVEYKGSEWTSRNISVSGRPYKLINADNSTIAVDKDFNGMDIIDIEASNSTFYPLKSIVDAAYISGEIYSLDRNGTIYRLLNGSFSPILGTKEATGFTLVSDSGHRKAAVCHPDRDEVGVYDLGPLDEVDDPNYTGADRLAPGSHKLDEGTQPYEVRTADIDNDGKTDYVTLNYGTGADITVIDGAGARGFYAGRYVRDLFIADLNGDGSPDLAAVSEYTGMLTIIDGLNEVDISDISIGDGTWDDRAGDTKETTGIGAKGVDVEKKNGTIRLRTNGKETITLRANKTVVVRIEIKFGRKAEENWVPCAICFSLVVIAAIVLLAKKKIR